MMITLRTRALLRPAAGSQPLIQYSQQPFSFFGGIFGKKKEEPKIVKKIEKEVVVEVEPAKYHKESVDAATKEEDAVDIKSKIRTLDRTGPNNLFGKYQRQRKTLKERNSNLEEHLHPSLAQNDRVSIQKFESNFFKRGLDQDETPFPISPKVGPYLVEKPIFGAKNYYWCSCGMSKEQPFCDSSHRGSMLKPLKFSLDEKSEKLHLCGCKLTKQAPFCDGQTCKTILSGNKFEAAEILLNEHQGTGTPSSDRDLK